MARKPRIHVPHGVYHVMLRGNNKQKIFFTNADFCRLSLLLQEATGRFNCRIHAFCFMNNHVHMALQVGDIPLSKIMQNIAFRYARWINKQQDRIGHLFQGRYRAILVDHEKYLLTLIRYIHLNPVRAKIVEQPHEYYWSGHCVYLGINHLPWLTTEWVLTLFSQQKGAAIKGYQNFIAQTEQTQEDEFFAQYPISETVLGDETFKMNLMIPDNVKIPSITTEEVISFFCKKYNIPHEMLFHTFRHRQISQIRAEISWLCLQLKNCTVKDMATLLHRSPSHISDIVKKITPEQQDKIMGFKNELLTSI